MRLPQGLVARLLLAQLAVVGVAVLTMVATAAIGVIGLGATIALTMGAGPGGAPVVAAAPGPVVASSSSKR